MPPPSFMLVLTVAPGSGALTEAVVAAAAAAAGVSAGTRWLSPGDAWEGRLAAPADDLAALRAAIARAVGTVAVDVNIVPDTPDARRKRLLCADMESTVIEQELIDEIAALAGRHEEISAITAAAMRGEIDFAASLERRVALFEGLDVRSLEAILARATLMAGAEALVRTMRANGARTALISGGFTVFAEPVAARLGFDAVVANTLEIENGRLTGRVRAPILGREGKAEALKKFARERGLDPFQTLAVGDGANDIAMLAAAGLGVAFRAKPIVRAEAPVAITHGDLTGLLYLQGYARSEFIDPKNIPA